MYANISLDLPLNQLFTYEIPENQLDLVKVGVRVKVNFNGRNIIGYVIELIEPKPPFKTKKISEVLDDEIIFDDDAIKLADWISKFYICSFGEALSLIVPKTKATKRKKKAETDNFGSNLTSFHKLNAEQLEIFKQINKYVGADEFKSFLIYGITGSGKTEIYKHLVKSVINAGKSALLLVPEISLTPQMINRFRKSFTEKTAVIHSKITPTEKLRNYKSIFNNEAKIILGARSAIFSQARNLGIIIIDEEHENTYKSSDTPRYNARQVAYKIALDKKIPLVFGSATPSVETYYTASEGNIILTKLRQRHSVYENQDVQVIDMRKEESNMLFSKKLLDKIQDRLTKKEQSIIFLNRRGYSNFLLCSKCGYVYKCPNCGISLTYHKFDNRCICHYCNFEAIPETTCPSCNKGKMKKMGVGTEKIEEFLKENFPDANIERMDVDTTRKKGTHNKILANIKNGKTDILIGTQMVAKGLHYPNITLVGVVLADITLNVPDFRAAERTFSLLTQVAGRAGRGNIQGEVIVQTYNPEHYAIKDALKQDFENFYSQEIAIRKEFNYPPVCRFIKLLVRSENRELVVKKIFELAKMLNSKKDTEFVDLLGPAPCPIEKINKNYRWQIILRSKKLNLIKKLALISKRVMDKEQKAYLEIDIDPVSMI